MLEVAAGREDIPPPFESSPCFLWSRGCPCSPARAGLALDVCSRIGAIEGGLCPSTPRLGPHPKKGCKNTPLVVGFGDNQGNSSRDGVYPLSCTGLGAVGAQPGVTVGISSPGWGQAEGLKQKGWKMGAAPSSCGGGGLGCGDKPGSFTLALIALGT